MESLFIHKVSRFLPSSCSSCHVKNVSDVVENFMTDSQNLHESAPPKNPKHKKDFLGFSPATNEGRRCPPVTPISVVDSHLKWRAREGEVWNSSSSSNGGWFSGEEVEDDDKTDTLFSLSSTSSRSFTHPKTRRSDDKTSEMWATMPREFKPPEKVEQKIAKTRRRRNESDLRQVEFDYYSNSPSNRRRKKMTRRQRKGKTRMVMMGYAIEKSTNDPYYEFRRSMVEMIVEKQIFGAEDLQSLLQCFLSLNSSYFHHIIVEVFSEIIQTLVTQ